MKVFISSVTNFFLLLPVLITSIIVFIAGPLNFAFGQADPVVSASVNTPKVINTIDERIYSHFLEHIYNSCNGGLWGELVWNRSLEAGKFPGWSFENGVLKQCSLDIDCRYILNTNAQDSSTWSDYDIRVLAKKTAGREGFLIMFRVSEDGRSYYWLNLGGWDNKYIAIEKETPTSNGRHVVGKKTEIPPIEIDQIYDIRVLVVGQNIKVFVNQELTHEIVDFEDDAPHSGGVGVGTWATKAEFGAVQVRNLHRRTLLTLDDISPTPNSSLEVRYWNVEGDVQGKEGDARNSARYLSFKNKGTLSQGNFSLKQGETYDYSFWTRGQGTVTFNILSDDSKKMIIGSFSIDSTEWIKQTGEFSIPQSSDNAIISLDFTPVKKCNLDIDQISVFPRSWKENTNGLRPDLLDAIIQIRPTMIRWPGGCYASAYRWKSGVGPQDDRVAFPMELWNDVDVNSFGIDEFITLCRRVNAEPIMVVNIGTAQWIDSVGDPQLTSNDWLQEVCDWVEYCNGDETTKWGSIRAQNGHKEPYRIKYWEIDNEVRSTDTPSDKYIAIINELVPRMKKIDPSIKIIVCGSWMGDKMKWDADVITGAANNFDYLSTHRYDDPEGFAFNPWDNQRFFESHREMIANSANPEIKIFNSEWNAQSTDWRTGLHAGGFLNCCERASDIVGIAAPALFLRHKTATGWDNAFINFDNKSWYPAPNYTVMKLRRDSYAPYLIEMTSNSPLLNGDNPLINAVATKSKDGKTIFIKIVNNYENNIKFNLTFDQSIKLSDAKVSAQSITPRLQPNEELKAKLQKRNTFEDPDNISPVELSVQTDDQTLSSLLESFSASVIKVQIQ